MDATSSPARRTILTTGAALAVTGVLAPKQAQAAGAARPRISTDPFTLGVASGHPTSSSVVLWTRLAPEPFDPDGGIPQERHSRSITVHWEVAADPRFKRVLRRGASSARGPVHSVHATVAGLTPDRWFYYRFRVGSHVSRVGRTRTLPEHRSPVDSLRFAVASCQRLEHGYWTAYRDMLDRDLDLVVHVGDYIYENYYSGQLREAEVPLAQRRTVTTLDEYRARHALYRLDPMLQDAHAQYPFVFILDNHDAVEDGDAATRQLRSDAYRAFYEHLPLPASAAPRGASMRIRRSFDYGALARFYLLDTRQFRDDQHVCSAKDIVGPVCDSVLAPSRTMLGAEQESWLARSLDQSRARWNVLTNTVMFAPFDFSTTSDPSIYYASWDGYPENRRRVIDAVRTSGAKNPVVLSGDWHMHFALDVTDERGKTVMPEFMATAVGSDPGFTGSLTRPAVPRNANVRFYEESRGYLACTVTRGEWRSDFITSDATSPTGGSRITSSWVVSSGDPQMHEAPAG